MMIQRQRVQFDEVSRFDEHERKEIKTYLNETMKFFSVQENKKN